MFAAAGLVVGIIIQNKLGLNIWLWLALLCSFATAGVIVFVLQKGLKNPEPMAYLVFLCFICLGALRLMSYCQPVPNDIRNFVGRQRTLATIRGTLITNPRLSSRKNWQFGKFVPFDPAGSFYVKLGQIETQQGWADVAGIVRLQVTGPVLDLQSGDYIQAYCWLDRFGTAQNPGQFDMAKYLAGRNVYVGASVKSRAGVELLHSTGRGWFTKVRNRLRETAAVALLGSTEADDDSQALLQALLLGVRRNIDSSTYQAFRRTGLLHFISLSGMHVGILIGIIWWLSRRVGLLNFGRAIVCIIAVILFVMIVPPRAPTLRAAIICLVFCTAFIFHRKSSPLNSLSLSAVILLLVRPTNVFSIGWQLSFATVLGLLLFCGRIHLFLYDKITGLSWGKKAPKTRPFYRIVSRPGPYLLRLFSTGFTAWVSGAGILLYHFHTIVPLTSLWTIVVFPFVAAILTLGFLKIILMFLLPTVGMLLGIIVTWLSDVLIWLVQQISSLGISEILIGKVPLVFILCYYCFLLFAAFMFFSRPFIKKFICTAAVISLVGFLGITKWQRSNRDYLALHFLAVGHGQAVLAELPGSANILFDAGSINMSDCGTRIVIPFLNFKGINEIEAILISHNDADHINGIPEISQACNVKKIYANEAFFASADRWKTSVFLRKWLVDNGLKIQSVEKELKFANSAEIRLLWPDEQIWPTENLSDNDGSNVILITFAGRKILLCSDIGKFAQTKVSQTWPDLKVDIVATPHHGSARTLAEGFLESLEPGILISSCGRRDYERVAGRPSDSVQCFYTAIDGAISIAVSKDGNIKVQSFVAESL